MCLCSLIANPYQFADVAVIFVHLLNVAMHDFESDEFVIGGGAPGDEEEGCIATVDNLGICGSVKRGSLGEILSSRTFVF